MARSTKIKSKLVVEDSLELKQLDPGTVPVLDENNNVVSSVITSSELSNLSGTTAPIQEQLNDENQKIDEHIGDLDNPHSTTKDQLGLSEVDNTSDLDKPVSIATQAALDSLSDSFKYAQVVYVDRTNTSTDTPDGSLNKPFKSLEAMYNAITDASASKRYACVIAPGTYVEASTIRIKGWIDLTAFATDTVGIGVAGGATLKWSNNNPGRVFVKDVSFTVGLEVLNDNPTGTSGVVFDLDNVDAPSLIFRGRGGGRDFIQLRNDTRISGSCTIQSAATTIFDSTNISTLIMNDVGCVFPDSFGSAITASLRSNYVGAVSITATTFDVYTDAWGTIIAGNLNIVSNSPSFPCVFNVDATSYPLGTINLTGSNPAQLERTSVSESIRYTPAVSSNWSSPLPTDVKKALDSLAADKLSSVPVDSVNGKTGEVVLDKTDIGLSEVDNTSDLDKPISTATQAALDLKYDASNPDGFVNTQEAADAAPVQSVNTKIGDVVLDKTDIGLDQVDNTSDLDKPISTATQAALDLKQDQLTFTPEDVANKSTDTLLGTSDTLYPTQNAVKVFVENSITAASVPDATTEVKGSIKLAGDLSGTADSPTVPGLADKIDSSREGQPDGIATLDSNGKVPATQLPSYVDDVIEADDFASLPDPGETGKIYVTLDTNKTYRWSGSTYIEISPSEVNSVNGQTGIVVLDKDDVGLGNVDNTSDLDKPISTVTQAALDLKYDASNPAGYITLAEVPDKTSPGDIKELSFSLSNSQSTPENITGFAFSDTQVRGFTALVTVEIDADSDLFEQFTLNGIQKNGSWNMSTESIGDNTGLVFSITSTGQIQYVSNSYTRFVAGSIKFRAITTSI